LVVSLSGAQLETLGVVFNRLVKYDTTSKRSLRLAANLARRVSSQADAICARPAGNCSTGLMNARKDLAEEYDALKQPEQAARFRAEAAALDSKASDSAKK
jgi:hypothetical protein